MTRALAAASYVDYALEVAVTLGRSDSNGFADILIDLVFPIYAAPDYGYLIAVDGQKKSCCGSGREEK